MYKIAICEDDRKYIKILKKLILEAKVVDTNLLQFYEFYSGEQLFFHPQLDFDMIIIDIQMNGMDGYETAMKLRKMDNNFLLVFCSGVIMPTPKFFKANAFRYLDKNVPDEVMIEELSAIVKEMIERKEKPFVLCKYTSGKEQIRVYSDSILYIAIRGSGSQIFVHGKVKELYPTEVFRANGNLSAMAEIFGESHGFVRLHNSYIVNMAYIMRTTKESVELADGTILNIARSKLKYFQEIFAKYISAKYEG